jgi:hypothetical protein
MGINAALKNNRFFGKHDYLLMVLLPFSTDFQITSSEDLSS